MIAFEVLLNGNRVCIAGAEDLCVLTANVTAAGKLGKQTVPARPDETSGDIFYSLAGLTERENADDNVHMRWKSVVPLQVGDVIEVRVLETENVDVATTTVKPKERRP